MTQFTQGIILLVLSAGWVTLFVYIGQEIQKRRVMELEIEELQKRVQKLEQRNETLVLLTEKVTSLHDDVDQVKKNLEKINSGLQNFQGTLISLLEKKAFAASH